MNESLLASHLYLINVGWASTSYRLIKLLVRIESSIRRKAFNQNIYILMTLIIRDALLSDLTTIIEIYNAAIPGQQATGDLEPISVESRKAWFKQHSPSSYPIWVAQREQDIVGWLSLQRFYGRAAYAKTAEVSVYIDPNYQGQGIGKQLVEYMLKQCPTLNLTALVCFIFAHNLASLNLFKNFGFESWGYLPEVAQMSEGVKDLVILGRKI